MNIMRSCVKLERFKHGTPNNSVNLYAVNPWQIHRAFWQRSQKSLLLLYFRRWQGYVESPSELYT